MNTLFSSSLLACAALLSLSAGCNPSGLEPITSGSSSSTSSTSASTSTSTSTGSGETGGAGSEAGSSTSGTGGSSENGCSPACGSATICVEGACHGLVQLDAASTMNKGVCTIALDAANVYWKTSDVRRVPKAGGPSTLLDSSTSSPGGLVVDDTYLYWTDFGIQRAEKTSPEKPGTTAGVFYADEGGSPARLVGDGTKLYYVDGYTLYEAPESGPPAPQAPPTAFSDTWSSVVGTPIAVDAKSVYLWTEAASVLTRVDKDGQKSSTVATRGNSTIDDTCGIVVDATGVYFSTAPKPGQGGLVVKAGSGGGLPTVLVDATNGANGVFALDESTLYFMTPTGVMKMPKSGGAAVLVSPLSLPSPFPTCLAVDADHVYWVDGLKLMALAK
jgi:hypothetical protein